MGKIDVKQEASTPANPPATYARIYPKSDGQWYGLTPAGVETQLGPISYGTPVAIGTANSAGVASTAARSDHVHAHGDQTVGSLHAVATSSVNGFMSAADKAKSDARVFGFLSYTHGSSQSTTQTNTGYAAMSFDTDTGSFANSLLTKTSATEIRTDFTGYIRVSAKILAQNTSANDRPLRAIIRKNGTAIDWTEMRALGKTNTDRFTSCAGTFLIACATNDLFSVGYSNAEAVTDTIQVNANQANFSIEARYKTS